MFIFFKAKRRRKKFDELKRELRFYQPIFEYVSYDVHWVMLNRRLLRILVRRIETMYEIEQQALEAAIDLDNNTIEYIELLTLFFENRITALRDYFDQYYMSINPLIQESPDFFYGHFDYITKILINIKAEIKRQQISMLQLRYLNNYVFFFYMEIVQGINRFEQVSKELEQL
ncbi:hypothetical protein BK132_21845 [Paenibacillus sp. FSL H8-0259]|nr:hypothetical protein BK132_21845 [Paenibacillus sp. FSL H8-0259]